VDERATTRRVGTSALVHPAAAFVRFAAGAGADTRETDPTTASADLGAARHGPATDRVPAWVEEIPGSAARARTL
jgi:NAD-dependent deacetylase